MRLHLALASWEEIRFQPNNHENLDGYQKVNAAYARAFHLFGYGFSLLRLGKKEHAPKRKSPPGSPRTGLSSASGRNQNGKSAS
jgi:hypothetical protein